MHKNRADEDKLTDAGARSAARKVQRTLDIDVAVKFDGMLVMLMMNTRGEVNHGVDAGKRFAPFGRRADRSDMTSSSLPDSVRTPRRTAHPLRASKRQMAAHETARARHQDHG